MSATNILGEALKANLLAKSYGSYSSGGGYGLGLGIAAILIYLFFCLASYIYFAICLMLIAKKTSTPNSWMAWIPVLNLYLMCKAAGKSGLWILLLLIPFVNVVALILLWAGMAARLGRPAWWGILMIFPLVNVILMGILAFSKPKTPAFAPASSVSASPTPPVAPIASNQKKGNFCPKCGTKAQQTDKFCPDCGAKL